MLAGGTCAPITDYASYANRQVTIVAGLSTSDTYGSCDPCLSPPVTTSHTIHAGNYYYNPNYLVINVGDTVTWFNDGGFHDVNGDINFKLVLVLVIQLRFIYLQFLDLVQ